MTCGVIGGELMEAAATLPAAIDIASATNQAVSLLPVSGKDPI